MAGCKPWANLPLEVWISGTDVAGGSQVAVTNWPSSQAVTGTVNATCSGTVTVSGSVAVTGTFWQATQPVSITAPLAVTGTFFQATQPVSAAALPLPSGAATEATLATVARPSLLAVTNTGASGAAVTLTLPAIAGQFHYITHIRLTLYATAARTGSATPLVVTTTNLPGALAYTFETAQAIGTCIDRTMELGGNPLRSSVVNTPTTIVCPVATAGIWRVVAHYYGAA